MPHDEWLSTLLTTIGTSFDWVRNPGIGLVDAVGSVHDLDQETVVTNVFKCSKILRSAIHAARTLRHLDGMQIP